MGLDDVAHSVGNVSSERSIENHTISKHDWKWIIAYSPHTIEVLVSQTSNEEKKMFIEVMDELIEDGHPSFVMSDEQEEDIMIVRDNLVEEL